VEIQGKVDQIYAAGIWPPGMTGWINSGLVIAISNAPTAAAALNDRRMAPRAPAVLSILQPRLVTAELDMLCSVSIERTSPCFSVKQKMMFSLEFTLGLISPNHASESDH